MFYLLMKTGIDKCWDEGDPYMVETQVVYNDFLHPGSRGRVNKQWITWRVMSGEWDLRPAAWVIRKGEKIMELARALRKFQAEVEKLTEVSV